MGAPIARARALAHRVHQRPGLEAGVVDAAGVAEIAGHRGQRGLAGLGQNGGGGVGVEVDVHASILRSRDRKKLAL
ncbi:hypothetical protein [Variovorax sp. UC122_21]|uniref:hypothetical protein n=1 Tax=Variovorax sp. UC122_21 TaxID=3374554 RepID=UPI0037565457